MNLDIPDPLSVFDVILDESSGLDSSAALGRPSSASAT